MSVRSDTGPFALIPVWVLDLPISHLALRVYACHADWADRNGSHTHGRVAIAQRVGCSVQTVDDCHKALVKHGALQVERRKSDSGDPTSNRYIVARVIPRVAKQETLPGQVDQATGGVVGDALTRSKDYEQEGPFPEQAVENVQPMPATLRQHLPKRPEQCPWRRQQVRADHGKLDPYRRRCHLEPDHEGPHQLPPKAKQANDGVWVNPETGETITQHDEAAS